jgi:hypothetical protein
MKINIDKRNFSEKEIYSKILEFLSTLNPDPDKRLQDTEVKLLVEFLTLPEKYKYYRFATPSRTRVQKNAAADGWVISRTNLNNKLYKILEKGYLVRDEDSVIYLDPSVRSILDKLANKEEVSITLNFSLEDVQTS